MPPMVVSPSPVSRAPQEHQLNRTKKRISMTTKDLIPEVGSGPYFWMIAVGVRAGNGAGGPPGTQDGTRGATGPRADSRAAASDACEARVPAPEDRATLPSRDMHQSPKWGNNPS